MSDQFSKTISSVTNATPISDELKRAGRIEDKRVEKPGARGKRGERRRFPLSNIEPPDTNLWNQIIEAVEAFNMHQEVRKSPFVVRIWAQNNGFRVQLILEETGALIKQSRPIPFDKVTTNDLHQILNELIAERGVVLDITS